MNMKLYTFKVISLGLLLAAILTGCVDLFTLPSASISSNDQWLAVLTTDVEGSRTNLRAINITDGLTTPIGDTFDQQGAFDWHPITQEIAYYNLSFDGVPSIKVQDMSSPDNFGIDLFGVFAFPRPFWITQLAYSPDGNYLAMSTILFPDGTDLITVDITQTSTEAAMFIADLDAGTVTAITNIGERFPSTLAWSPNSSNLAYTAWMDINGDGSPYGEGDTPSIFVYDVATQNTIHIEGYTVSPTWVDATQLVYIDYEIDTATDSASTSIQSFNITDNSSQNLIQSTNKFLYTAVSASPDGTLLAILGTADQSETLLADTFDIEQDLVQVAPDHIFIANANGSNLMDIYAPLPTDILFLDIPVWSNDGLSLYISSANPIGIATASFPISDDVETIPQQRIVAIDVATPSNYQTIYEGLITSSGIPHLLSGLELFSIQE